MFSPDGTLISASSALNCGVRVQNDNHFEGKTIIKDSPRHVHRKGQFSGKFEKILSLTSILALYDIPTACPPCVNDMRITGRDEVSCD